MILVTTGTALADDKLIEAIDDFVHIKAISNDIVAQIGHGRYTPKSFRFFKFVHDLKHYMKIADIVISNCGAGTVFEVLELGKPLIVMQNPNIIGGHEWELVSKLEELNLLFWCKDYRDLPGLIKKIETHKFNHMNFKKFDYTEFNSLVGL